MYKGKMETPILYIDNQSAIKLIKNPEYHKRTKHIDVRYHFIREKYMKGKFIVDYIDTKRQEVDLFTKSLERLRFERLRDLIGVGKKTKIVKKTCKYTQ